MKAEETPDWECPICYEILSGQIFQCKEGHLFCEACRKQFIENDIASCASCRTPLNSGTISRVRVFERQLDKMLLPCSFEGCKEKLSRQLIQNHEKSCAFGATQNNLKLDLCKSLGYNGCNFKLTQRQNDGDAAAEHLKNNHTCRHIKDRSEKPFIFTDFWNSSGKSWLFLFSLTKPTKKNILIILKVRDNYLCISCIDLASTKSTSPPSKETEVTFMIPNKKASKFTWTCVVAPGSASWDYIRNPQLKTSIAYLRQLCATNKDFEIHFKIH